MDRVSKINKMKRYHLIFVLIVIAAGGVLIYGTLTAEDIERGEQLYEEYCTTCHGDDLDGGMAGSLIDGDWQFGSKDSHIFRNVKYGILDRGMPGFEGTLSDDDIRNILAYVQKNEGTAPAVSNELIGEIKLLDYDLRVEIWIDDLDIPWAIDFPEADLALVTERPGYLRVVRKGSLQPEPVAETPEVLHKGQGGLLDVAVDPGYAKNGWVYLAYSHELDNGLAMTRIVRGKIRKNRWEDQQILYEADHDHYLSTKHHYGCRIVFDKKGYLYFSIGERGIMEHAQNTDRPNGKIHRIYPDASIPEDNPLVNGPVPSIYSYGNRNPQGLAVHPVTDELWETEHGPLGGDELNLIRSGINYGWPVITYGKNYDGSTISDLTHREDMAQPVYYWRPSIAVCGLDFYRGDEFPKWQNKLLVGALKYEEVRLLDIEDNRVLHEELILKNYGRVRDVVAGPDGAIYVALNDPGRILRLSNADNK